MSSLDSPLEEAGFEPSVPLRERRPFRDAPYKIPGRWIQGSGTNLEEGYQKLRSPFAPPRSWQQTTKTWSGPRCRIHNEAQPVRREDCPRNSLRITWRRSYDPGSGCRMVLVRRGRCRIELAVALLDPPRANMALHRDADMVWAIVGTARRSLIFIFSAVI